MMWNIELSGSIELGGPVGRGGEEEENIIIQNIESIKKDYSSKILYLTLLKIISCGTDLTL